MKIIIFIISLIFSTFTFSQSKNYSDLVNPFIGTGGHGHTYPGVTEPFGFMQLSPDTRLNGWDGCSGYHYTDSIIYGFSHTHLSGTGVSDLGDVLIMPFNGKNRWSNGSDGKNGYNSHFSHQNEKANAGYYSVLLDDSNIKVELTTAAHSGFHKYQYSNNKERKIIIDLEHRDRFIDADISKLNDSTFVGKRISKAWAEKQYIYFVIQLSEKPTQTYFDENNNTYYTKLILEFSEDRKDLQVKIGISAVDIDGAINNLKTEIPHWDFEKTLTDNKKKWNKELSKINIETIDKDREIIFYTALYHSFLAPNIFSDADGRYRGTDLKIHESERNQYTVFSLWDTFRATHPFYTITQQKKTIDFINTFLNHYEKGGILPIWELNANYTKCMIGYHSIPVIVDAYVKGIRDFDTELALAAMLHSAELSHLGLDVYQKNGFIGSQDEAESVSKTLEYAYDDWCIAVFADSLGRDSIAKVYYARALHYKNLYNPNSKFMEPKFNGGFKTSFRPDEVTFDYTEANSWQYSLFAPQDIDGLIKLIGGKDELESWLDKLFTTSSETVGRHQVDITGLIGQYAHGNEPSHHMAYLYNFTNNASKTQHYVNQILTNLYSNAPDGLSGNEDCGQMSSWYVMSAVGIYSLTPGTDKYMLGAPLFNHSHINLENGKTFNIIANNLGSTNIYVKSVSLNNKPHDRYYVTHSELMAGGTLVFEMTDHPSKNYGISPVQEIENENLIVPYLKNSNSVFNKKMSIEIVNPNSTGKIKYYTSNNKEKTYIKPIKINKTEVLTSWVTNDTISSYKVTSTHKKVNDKWDVKLNSKPHDQYKGESNRELIDKQNGGNDFRTGKWQGFYDQDMDIEIYFHKKIKVNSISVRFLQDANSWIWYPSYVDFYYSNNGIDWIKLNTIKNIIPNTEYGGLTQNITINQPIKARYIKVVAKNMGNCPVWHPGKGNGTFIFADEIEVR
jgi:predicted alpha-1,2-mannosidase